MAVERDASGPFQDTGTGAVKQQEGPVTHHFGPRENLQPDVVELPVRDTGTGAVQQSEEPVTYYSPWAKPADDEQEVAAKVVDAPPERKKPAAARRASGK